MTTIQTIDWAKAEYSKGNRSLSVLIGRAIPDPRKMTEEEFERKLNNDDYIYHALKEEGRSLIQ